MPSYTSYLPGNPLYQQAVGGDPAIGYTASQFRQLIGAVFPRPGRGPHGDSFTVQQAASGGPNKSVDIWPGFVVLGETTAYERWLLHLPARLNIPISGFTWPVPSTRTHRVYVVLEDKSLSGVSADTAHPYCGKVVITEDTGGTDHLVPPGSPEPRHWILLATITVVPGQASISNTSITMASSRSHYGSAQYPLTLSGGIVEGASSTASQPRYSVSGNILTLMGQLARADGTAIMPGTSLGVLPFGYVPRVHRYGVGGGEMGPGTTRPFWRAHIDPTNGLIEATFPTDYAPKWLSLDGITFPLD